MIGDYILTQETANGTQEVRIPGEVPKLFVSGISTISAWRIEGDGCSFLLNGTSVYVTNPSKARSVTIIGDIPSGTVLDFTKLPNLDTIFLMNTPLVNPPIVAGMANLKCVQFNGNHFSATPNLSGLVQLNTLGLQNDSRFPLTVPPNISDSAKLGWVFMMNNAFPSVDGIISTVAANASMLQSFGGKMNLRGIAAPTAGATANLATLAALHWDVITA